MRWWLGCAVLLLVSMPAAAELEGEVARFSYAAGFQLGEALIGEGLEALDPAEVGGGLAAVVSGAETRLTSQEMGVAMRGRGQGAGAERDFSYAVGVQRGGRLLQQGLGSLDPGALRRGVEDSLYRRPAAISLGEMMSLVAARKAQVAAAREALAQGNAVAGDRYRAANRDKAGVKQRRSGLQYEVLAEGHGKRPRKDSTVVVRYRGSHLNGEEFDSSEAHGGPATLSLKQVIAGWQEALVRMRPGARWRLVVGPELAYGAPGRPPVIGPNETLIFEIELVEVR